MKTKLLLTAVFALALLSGCYDDSEIFERLNSYEERLSKLETVCDKQNTNISSLQTIVAALQEKDYVTDVAPITEGGDVIGYTITFCKSGSITIYNGEDGYVPVLGVKQYSDGLWYWTIDGNWMTTADGSKVRASAIDGEDGKPGQNGQNGKDGVTPKLKIEDGYWFVSYDRGHTWERYAPATGEKGDKGEQGPQGDKGGQGEKGDSMFQDVTYDANYVYITLADGTKLVVPCSKNYSGENVVGPATVVISKVTATSATFAGNIDLQENLRPYTRVTVYYSKAEDFNIHDADSKYTTTFDENGDFSIVLKPLDFGMSYRYCVEVTIKNEQYYGDVLDFITGNVTFSELSVVPSYFKAEVSGSVNGLSEQDKEYIKVGVLYSSESGKVENGEGKKIEATEISADGVFSVRFSDLTKETKYYCCSYVKQGGSYIYGTSAEFTTLKHPYELSYDLNVESATDLSSSASANCYIVSNTGRYKFSTVKGNSTTSVGSVATASILWETFGTDTAPEPLDLIGGVCYKDGYIAFQTADTFKDGNAVIAAKDASGNILWSWHIWFTDQPQGQTYYRNAGTMMDRNLGATSSTPGDVGALGLLYQWGRKDPFLGSSSIHYESMAEARSTITWPSAVSSDSSNGTIAYATAHPTTFITYNIKNCDWYYTGDSSTDNTRWTTSGNEKSVYDPCPSGWRVPDGGSSGVWSTALGSSSSFTDKLLYDSTYDGMNFSGKFGSDQTIWYPASGSRSSRGGSLSNVGYGGYYWSASPNGYFAYCLSINNKVDGFVSPSSEEYRAEGQSVRCLQE